MPDFLQTGRWPPEYAILLALILAIAAVVIVLTLAVLRYNMRVLLLQRERLEYEVALKRELIQRGLPAEELEKAVQLLKLDEQPSAARRPSSTKTGGQLDAAIVEHLTLLEEVSPEGIEQAISLVRAADRDGKEAALTLLENLDGKKNEGIETQGEVVLAAVRSLCRPSEKPRAEAKPQPLELSSHITR